MVAVDDIRPHEARLGRDGRLAPAPIQELIGMKLSEIEEGRAVWELVPGEQHYNPIGSVHAGLAMTPDNVDLLVLAADLRRRQQPARILSPAYSCFPRS